jgi:hypothetical protein
LVYGVLANVVYAAILWGAQRLVALMDRRSPSLRPIVFWVLGLVWVGGNWAAINASGAAATRLFPVAGLIFLALVGYELSGFWRTGVYGADVSIRKGIDHERSLKLATNRFEFLGTGARKLTETNEFERAMKRCHRQGQAIRFLLLDPTKGESELLEAAKRAGHDRQTYIKRVEDSLNEIARLVLDRGINIEVRFYSRVQPFRLVFIDGAICLLGYNVYGEESHPDHPQLHIRNYRSKRDVNTFYYAFSRHFEDMWSQAEPWEPEGWR